MSKAYSLLAGCLTVTVGLVLLIHPAYAPPASHPVGRSASPREHHRQDGGSAERDLRPRDSNDNVQSFDQLHRDSPEQLRNKLERIENDSAEKLWAATAPGSQHFAVVDATTNPTERRALEARLQSNPIAQRISLLDWRLAARPTLGEIGDVLELAARPLPPKFELALFLDPSSFGSAVPAIKAAWNRNSTASMPHTDYLDEFLEARRGGLLLVVGHVESNDFVMQDALGHRMTLSIPLLLRKSLKHNVLVVPVGCKTAGAGAPIGFLENIGTDAVERFLRQLPQDKPAFADLFAGLRTIGDTQVTLRDVLGQLDIQIKSEDAPEAQVSRVKIQYPSPASTPTLSSGSTLSSTSSLSFAASVLDDADQLRPWWDRNWARAIYQNPLTYLAVSSLLALVARVWRQRILATPYVLPNRLLAAGLKAVVAVYLWIALPVTLVWLLNLEAAGAMIAYIAIIGVISTYRGATTKSHEVQ